MKRKFEYIDITLKKKCTQILEVLQFSSTNFQILKLLHDRRLIKTRAKAKRQNGLKLKTNKMQRKKGIDKR